MAADDPDATPDARGSDWRDRRVFNQAERIDGALPARRPLGPVIVAGLAMLGVTALARVLGASAWVAVGAGVAVFVLLLALRGRGGGASVSAGAARAAEGLSARLQAKDRAVSPAPGVDVADVEERLRAAEAVLVEIERLRAKPAISAVSAELGRFVDAARAVLDHLAEDPSDLPQARKFLRVYVPSARDALRRYADLGVKDAALAERLRAVVLDIKATADRVLEALRADERIALEVELDVLSDRLRAETR